MASLKKKKKVIPGGILSGKIFCQNPYFSKEIYCPFQLGMGKYIDRRKVPEIFDCILSYNWSFCVGTPPSPIPRVAPKKCGPPSPWGLDPLGGPPFWTKILVETKSDLGGEYGEIGSLKPFLKASWPPEITIWAQGNPFYAHFHQYLPLFFKKKFACDEKVMVQKSSVAPPPGD